MSHDEKKKLITIVIYGTPFEVEKEEITYADLVTLAYPDFPQHPETTYTVTYKRGQGNKPEGTLSSGGTVKLKDRMVFNVSRTGQS